jgi:cyclopropane fatty-acyl-phospholipid synthase-like methyltransferase
VFAYLADHPDAAALFNEMLTEWRAQRDAAVAEAYDFAGVQTLADVGSGYGNLLVTILRRHPTMRGVLFDQPTVVAAARTTLEQGGVADRCSAVGGDMFAAVPRGGDAYVLANIIHDWGDEESVTILTRCHEAMERRGRLLLVEAVTVPGAMRPAVASVDLRMLAMVGEARQRTQAEFQTLLDRSGFRLMRSVPTTTDFSIIEAVPM